MRQILFAAALGLVFGTSATAQEPQSLTFANGFIDRCLADMGETRRQSAGGLSCSCFAGYIVGRASNRQLEILVPFLRARTDDENADIAQRLVNLGYSADEIMAAGNLLVEISETASPACDYLRN